MVVEDEYVSSRYACLRSSFQGIGEKLRFNDECLYLSSAEGVSEFVRRMGWVDTSEYTAEGEDAQKSHGVVDLGQYR